MFKTYDVSYVTFYIRINCIENKDAMVKPVSYSARRQALLDRQWKSQIYLNLKVFNTCICICICIYVKKPRGRVIDGWYTSTKL